MADATNTQLSVVDQLKSKFTDIKDKLKQSNLTKSVFDELTADAKLVQDKLNELLSKQGFISQSDIEDAYTILQDQKRKELEKLNSSGTKNIGMYLLGGAVVLIAIYLYNKNKN